MKLGVAARRLYVASLGLALLSAPGTSEAQRAVDVQVGSWELDGSDPTLYSASLWWHLTGPLNFGVQGLAVVDPSPLDASLYGLLPQISLFRGSRKIAPYGVGGLGFALRAGGSDEFVAIWNLGLGVELNPVSWFGFALEAARFVEDEGFRGFWNLEETDRRGWMISARASVRWGVPSGGTTRPTASPPPVYHDPQPSEPLSDAGLAVAGQIVATALAAMGEPYRWGGTSTDEGFDCSGLIYYAYTTHGVSVPRVSRDQARAGRAVARNAATLEAGDILSFANSGSGVSHVGLYVGNGRFIHATASGGVRVSRLETSDPDNRWWFERWVGARRVLR